MYTALSNIDFAKLENRSIMSGKYIGRVTDMYDGDTMKVALFNESGKLELLQIRVMGSDTPEMKGDTLVAAKLAKNEALCYIGADEACDLPNGRKMVEYFQHTPIFVELEFVEIREKYGRFLAHVRKPGSSMTLSEHLIKAGFANPYEGGTKDQLCFTSDVTDEDLLQAIEGEPFKNETAEEKAIVMKIKEYVMDSPSTYSKHIKALERKRIVRKLRSSSIKSAEAFVAAL